MLAPPTSRDSMDSSTGSLSIHSAQSLAEGSDSDRNEHGDFPARDRYQARKPALARFLADFTLGFADGLTVPFALTAGLSALGEAETVIYAGLAEVCAGSISMGIGGYLSAQSETQGSETSQEIKENTPAAETDQEKALISNVQTVDDYLAPLQLPPGLSEAVRIHIHGNPRITQELSHWDRVAGNRFDTFSPLVVGLNIALGYLVGGSFPLFPYFLVNDIRSGMRWSSAVCLVVLFIFGFSKSWLLRQHDAKIQPGSQACSTHWRRYKRSYLEGIRMVGFGAIAAAAAVLCVRLFRGVAP